MMIMIKIMMKIMMKKLTRKWLKTSARRCVRSQSHECPEQELSQILETFKHNYQWTHLDLNLCKHFINNWYHEVITLLTLRVLMAMIWSTPWGEGRIFAIQKRHRKSKIKNLRREKSIPNGHWVCFREVGWQAGAKPVEHVFLYFLYFVVVFVVAFVFVCICLCSGLVKTASPTSSMQC